MQSQQICCKNVYFLKDNFCAVCVTFMGFLKVVLSDSSQCDIALSLTLQCCTVSRSAESAILVKNSSKTHIYYIIKEDNNWQQSRDTGSLKKGTENLKFLYRLKRKVEACPLNTDLYWRLLRPSSAC